MDCELPVGGHCVHHLTPGSFLHTKKKGTSTPNPWSNHMQMACTNRKCILPFFGKEENTKTFSVVAHMELHCLVKPGYRLQTHRYTNLLMKLPASDTSSLNFSDSAVGMLFDMSCNNNNKNRKITLEPKQVKKKCQSCNKIAPSNKKWCSETDKYPFKILFPFQLASKDNLTTPSVYKSEIRAVKVMELKLQISKKCQQTRCPSYLWWQPLT